MIFNKNRHTHRDRAGAFLSRRPQCVGSVACRSKFFTQKKFNFFSPEIKESTYHQLLDQGILRLRLSQLLANVDQLRLFPLVLRHDCRNNSCCNQLPSWSLSSLTLSHQQQRRPFRGRPDVLAHTPTPRLFPHNFDENKPKNPP